MSIIKGYFSGKGKTMVLTYKKNNIVNEFIRLMRETADVTTCAEENSQMRVFMKSNPEMNYKREAKLVLFVPYRGGAGKEVN